jgi:ABC-type branched-subunit amino acid transport system permease subunit
MFEYLVSVGTLAAITAIIALGLNQRWGLSGQLDLGYYLYVALGAYIDGVLTLPNAHTQPDVSYILGLHLPFLAGFAGAGLGTGLVSLAIGAVALKNLRGDYFAIVTVAATIIAYTAISQYKPLFNGYNGLYGVTQPFASALNLSPQGYQTFYFALCVVVLVAVFVLLELLRRSPFGLAVKAAREDETAASAFGKHTYLLRLKAYVIGGVVAGLGGSLFMHYIMAFNPASWSPLETFLLYGALLVGGTANNLGAVVGVLIALIAFPQLSQLIPALGSNSDAGPAVQNIVVGLLIVAVLRFRAAGLLPELITMRGQLRTRGTWNWRRPGARQAVGVAGPAPRPAAATDAPSAAGAGGTADASRADGPAAPDGA